ncbi:hypothetical protein N9M66_05905 [Litoreibacter sp.]|nr:hypothetical protein [Litoreibacter sp.]
MLDLSQEVNSGALHAEIKEYLNEMQAELDIATADLVGEVKEAVIDLIAEIIGQIASSIAGAVLAYAVAIIISYISAGALDDFYGVETTSLTLQSNEAAGIEDGSALLRGSSHVLAAADLTPGHRDGDRFETKELEMQLFAHSGPDTSSLNGIVSFGVQWEFSGRETQLL